MRHWRQMGWGGKGEWVGWKVVVDCGTSKRVHDDKVNFSIATQPATRSKLHWHMCPQGFCAVALSTMVLWVNGLHKTLSFAGTIIGHVFVLELGPLLFCARWTVVGARGCVVAKLTFRKQPVVAERMEPGKLSNHANNHGGHGRERSQHRAVSHSPHLCDPACLVVPFRHVLPSARPRVHRPTFVACIGE